MTEARAEPVPGFGHASVSLPKPAVRPLHSVLRRVGLAALILGATVLLVYLDRAGYRDTAGGPLTVVDCLYYTTVTLSTTGYGDIVPVAESARLVNALVITPLRVAFLIILVGTTLEVLAERTRQEWRLSRWRKQLNGHVVIVGFGTKGRSAALTLLGSGGPGGNGAYKRGTPTSHIVVVDERPEAVATANALGLTAVLGDGTRTEVLTQARVPQASTVVIAPRRDDTAVLAALTVRHIVERPAEQQDVGQAPRACREPVLAVVRGSRVLRFDDPAIGAIEQTDRLIVVRGALV